MSYVFLSYKSDDVERVAKLALALQSAGLKAWWDRYLPVGENWHAQIHAALEKANCVVVVWTNASVGPAGDFVRDEARVGKNRNILVPVLLDPETVPLGFRELQTVDLTRWNGSTSDIFFQDLVTAIKAKMQGRPVPAAKGPLQRLRQRIRVGVVSGILLALLGAFGANKFSLQKQACDMGIWQPAVSDACGAIGLGGRATKQERLDWQKRRAGNCNDLRNHLAKYPDGAYQAQAQGLLVGKQLRETELWTASEHALPLTSSRQASGAASLESARAEALSRGQRQAGDLCKGYGSGTLYRYKSAKAQVERWDCTSEQNGGVFCSFDGKAVCQMEVKETREEEMCGN